MELSILELESGQKTPHSHIIYDENTRIINLNYIIYHSFYDVEEEAFKYGIENTYKSRDIKCLFFHNVIYKLCETLSATKYDTNILYSGGVVYSDDRFSRAVKTITNKLRILLPFQLVESNYSAHTLNDRLISNNIESQTIIQKAINRDFEYDRTKYSLQKLKAFLRYNKLDFLDSVYFKQLHIKLSIIA